MPRSYPLGQVTFADGVNLGFPAGPCCNCGARSVLAVIEQDTRQPRLLGLGAERAYRLPLPFCTACVVTARRRPATLPQRLLVAAIAFALGAGGALLAGDVGGAETPAGYALPMGLGSALAVSLAWLLLTRPRGPQTSWFQPVRLVRMERDRGSGRLRAVGLVFTNERYGRAFAAANKEAIARGLLTAARA